MIQEHKLEELLEGPMEEAPLGRVPSPSHCHVRVRALTSRLSPSAGAMSAMDVEAGVEPAEQAAEHQNRPEVQPFAADEIGPAWTALIGYGDVQMDETSVAEVLRANEDFLERVLASRESIFLDPAEELLLAVAKRLRGQPRSEPHTTAFAEPAAAAVATAHAAAAAATAPAAALPPPLPPPHHPHTC